ncbi:MAG: nucleotidyl transferase AbiEii/AbiGii toxin family protein [Maribacter litoralis]|uniref:nucleotidyl transferase AbiEii/AbiGii toxin family protein n=1 Tax=Maribacter litoralis TaxID=2059726 RepID=UPI0032978D9C
MTLHENRELFNQAIRATAQRMGILDIYIEKDYWVCYALNTIFKGNFKDVVVFKGGTALSKCHEIIERFSEDIDLVVLTEEDDTNSEKRSKLRDITKSLIEPFIEEDVDGITNKKSQIRKVAFNYPKSFKGSYGQVRDKIILEASIFGSSEPFTTEVIATYIHQTIVETGQTKLIDDYQLEPFEVKVLDIKRTFCEKIMSLVRFSNSATPIVDLNNKIRHVYDIYRLLNIQEIKDFISTSNFDAMLKTVAEDDVVGYKNDNKWLVNHPKDAMIFSDSENVWKQLTNTYNNGFKNLVYGELPKEEDVLKTIQEVSARLESITWNIKV